jgi:type IV fimbrial biogenesis protein FimT
MVTLAVLAIVVSLAVPSFDNLLKDNRQASRANELVAALNLGRSEAVKRARSVTLCASTDGTSCAADDGADWGRGWLLFVDANSDGQRQASGDEERLRIQVPFGKHIGVRSSGFQHADHLRYNARGITDDDGSFVLCDDRGRGRARAINVSRTGRVSIGEDDNGDGIVQDVSGIDVTCP